MRNLRNISFIALVLFSACGKEDMNFPVDINSESKYIGTFETLNSDGISGEITLFISNGTYACSTSLPYGHGAGKLTVYDQTINFQDTLFFPIPAVYGPSYTLSGEHQYRFDGQKLTIWKPKNVGEVEYKLQLEN